jgi:hypothetical protein
LLESGFDVEEIEKASAEAKRIKLARMATLFFDTFPQYQQQQQQQQLLLTVPTVEQQQTTAETDGAMSIGIIPNVELPLVISVASA